MKVLVTGGAGYIGSQMARQLIERGDEVVIFDNLGEGHKKAIPEGAVLVVGDINDQKALDSLFNQYK